MKIFDLFVNISLALVKIYSVIIITNKVNNVEDFQSLKRILGIFHRSNKS